LATTDSRLLAVDWMSQNIPPGSTLYLTGNVWRTNRLFPKLRLLQAAYGTPDGSLRFTGGVPRTTWGSLLSYDRWTYDGEAGRFRSSRGAEEHLPDYIIVRESPLLPDEPPPVVAQLVKTSYQPIQSFRAYDPARTDYWFDLQDGFFLPFAHLAGVQRPGPNITIYQRHG